MANDYFVNVFSGKLNTKFQELTVAGGITASAFSVGQKAFERITIPRLNDITVKDYVVGTDITVESVGTTETVLIMNKQKYAAVEVNNIQEVQANINLLNGYATKVATALSDQIDKDVLTGIVADANTAGNTLTASEALTKDNVLDVLLIPARTFLNVAKVPADERYLVVNQSIEPLILASDVLTKNGSITQGYIGDAFGMKIFISSNLPANRLIVGAKTATEYGASLSETDVVSTEKGFSKIVKALEVYGSKVIKPEAVAEFVTL